MHWKQSYEFILKELDIPEKYQIHFANQGTYRSMFLINMETPEILLDLFCMNLTTFRDWCNKNKKLLS